MPKSSAVYFEKRTHFMSTFLVELAALAVFGRMFRIGAWIRGGARIGIAFGFRREALLGGSAYPAQRMQPFEYEFAGGGAHGIRLIGGQTHCAGFFHQTLNRVELAHHAGGIRILFEPERT